MKISNFTFAGDAVLQKIQLQKKSVIIILFILIHTILTIPTRWIPLGWMPLTRSPSSGKSEGGSFRNRPRPPTLLRDPPRQYTSIRIFRMEKESELDAVMRRKLFVNLRDGLLSLLPTRRWDHPKASLSNLQNGKESGLGAAIKNRNAICQVIRLGSRFLWMAPSLCLSLKLKTNTLKTKQNSKNSVQNGLWKREKH